MKIKTALKQAVLGVVSLSLIAGCSENTGGQVGAVPPPTSVEVATLAPRDVVLSTELPGRVASLRKAEVRPQVTGIIQKRLFEEGAFVEAGQQLYQIDAARYEAALQTAKANLERAQSNFDAANDRYKRYQNLLKQKAVSQQNFDDAQADFRQLKAELSVAEANVKTAQIDFDYTHVYAPISGRIGQSSVTEGALVTAQQAAVLVTIHQLDPIYVDVAQAASQLMAFRQQAASGGLSQANATVQLKFENGSAYQFPGSLKFSDMSVNERTGTIAMRAEFPNPDYLLLPGMFVRADVRQGTREQVLVVPQRAVTRSRSGDAQVMLVSPDNTVKAQAVVLGSVTHNGWIVENGLHAGDRVIVEGLQKVAPGATVNPVEATNSQPLVSGEQQ